MLHRWNTERPTTCPEATSKAGLTRPRLNPLQRQGQSEGRAVGPDPTDRDQQLLPLIPSTCNLHAVETPPHAAGEEAPGAPLLRLLPSHPPKTEQQGFPLLRPQEGSQEQAWP